ncbi:MAG: DUF3089 domain-containing protein [Chitinophagaceae bacterium]|nr:DUF3089 domain-containing protein [Chitinophagaceae bacterium]
MRLNTFLIALALLLFSCSDKYKAFQNRYSFRSTDGMPDYSDLNYWAAHPEKWDPSDSIPQPLRKESRDSLADVFFLHPTTYTQSIKANNATIDNDYLNAKTDYSSVLYQASVFNQYCRVFAPRYRQASIKVFFSKEEEQNEQAFTMAYNDIKNAFEYYLKHWNKGRPVIIAGHSQGSKFAERLLKDYFEGKPLYDQLVVAYIAGWSVPKDYFTSLSMCADSVQTGCICSWRTFRNGYVPSYLRFERGNSFVTNPLTWTTDNQYAPRSLNKGSVLVKFNKLYKHTTDGRIGNGFLYTRKPRFPWSFLYLTKNYHVGDINLFYMNIRENVGQRIRSFNKK